MFGILRTYESDLMVYNLNEVDSEQDNKEEFW